jgi:hypothetical protein
VRRGGVLFIFVFLSLQFIAAATSGFIMRAGYCAQEEAKGASDIWDFGRVRQGEVLKHDFVLKNETGNALEIAGIHTSCGCTASQAGKKILAPSESTTVSVTFNTKGYQGEVQQFIYVNTDQPDTADIIKYTVTAYVVK